MFDFFKKRRHAELRAEPIPAGWSDIISRSE
jgi:hypothetical protein